MNIRIILLFLLNCNLLYCQEVMKQEIADSAIFYSFSSQLTWNDFRASPKDSTDLIAEIAISICTTLVESNNQIILQLNTCMFPYSSWTLTDELTVLEHENYHFKITEYCRRSMIKELMEFNPVDGAKFIKWWIGDRLLNYEHCNKIRNKEYDEITEYSNNNSKQIQQQLSIERQLLTLDDFGATTIVFHFDKNGHLTHRELVY